MGKRGHSHIAPFTTCGNCLNRIRHQPNATPLRTLQDAVETEGLAVAKALDKEARSVLQEAGIDAETLQPIQHATACTSRVIDSPQVDAVLRELAPDPKTLEAMRANPVGYENAKVTINVSIDDVLAKKQKEHRK